MRFVHFGGETSPSYSLSVSDGALPSAASAGAVTFTNVNDAPVISANAISIAEGATLVLGTGNVNTTDPDNTPAQLTYTASGVTGGQFELVAAPGVAITSFTQAQINSGAVQFVHNGGEATAAYTLTVSDGALSSGSSAGSVTFTNVNDAPVLVNNTVSITEGATVTLTSANLLSTDPDNTDAQIVYTVSSVTGGHFALASAPGTPITYFTQAQINVGLIVFVHNGGEAAPSYSVSVSDGTASTPGGTNSGGTFTLVNDAPVVSGGLVSVTVTQGAANQTISLLPAFTDPDDPTLSYSATSANGTLVGATISGSNLVLSFSATLTGTTTVTVTATDAAGLFVSTTFNVTVNSAGVVTGVTLVNGVLTITGTNGCDLVLIERICNQYLVLTSFTNPIGSLYNVSAVNSIVVNVLNGSDLVALGCSVTIPATLNGGSGNDLLIGGNGVNTIIGGDGCDAIFGGNASDVLDGGNGNDEICGDGGNDTITGGDGHDELDGGDGNDLLFGEAGNDRLEGDNGHDILSGGSGNDELRGGKGRDLLIGGLGCDTLRGEHDDDIMVANRVTFEDNAVALQPCSPNGLPAAHSPPESPTSAAPALARD